MKNTMMLPQKPEKTPERSIEVTRIYLDRGGTVARSLWVTISPRNPLLKLALAPLIIALMMALLILMLVAMGFMLLAIALMRAISLARHRNSSRFRL
ncbi:hypothetical protein ES703_20877 [subsurface metagenome]